MAGEMDVSNHRNKLTDILVVDVAINRGLVDISFKWVDEVFSVWAK